jgi:hypothetical protein
LHRFNEELFELVFKRLVHKFWLAQGFSNQGFGSWERMGELICQCRNEASDDTSIPGSSEKEETREEPAFVVVALSDAL